MTCSGTLGACDAAASDSAAGGDLHGAGMGVPASRGDRTLSFR